MKFRIKRKANAEEIKSTTIRYAVENDYMQLWFADKAIIAFCDDKKAFDIDFLKFVAKTKWHRGFALARGLGGNTNLPVDLFLWDEITLMHNKTMKLAGKEHAMFWSMAHFGDVRTLKILLNMVRIISKEERLAMIDHSKHMRKLWAVARQERGKPALSLHTPAVLDRDDKVILAEHNLATPPRPSRFKKLWDILVGSK